MIDISTFQRMANTLALFFALVFFVLYVVPARAADPYSYGYQQSGAAAAPAKWQGLYAGLHAGAGLGKAGPANMSGFVGGAQAGYNAQFDKVVVGGEADLTVSSVDNKSFTGKFRQRYLASARGRLGYAMDNVLLYGTGGVAIGAHQYKDAVGSSDQTQVGLVLGAGAEFKVANAVSLRGEFLHYSFGSETYRTAYGPGNIQPSSNVLRAGVNVGF
jgi:outer membrane immunogenic protein